VRLEVENRFDFAVGRDVAGEVLPADASGADLHDRLAVQEQKNHDHEGNCEQNPEPGA
jgi:hypothetical protein